MTLQIRTIEDLQNTTPAHAAALGNTIGFQADLLQYVKEHRNRRSGDREVHTASCRHCGGDGEVRHYPRSVSCLHPSSFRADSCLQKIWYDLTDEVEEISNFAPETLMIFDTGHSVHDLLQGYAHKMYGDAFRDEVRARLDDHYISGSCDGVLDLGHAVCGFEIKSINRRGFEALSGPKKEHMWQATVYQKALDLPFMLYIYFCKDTSVIAEYCRPFDQGIWDAIESTLIQPVIEAGDNGPGAVRPDGKAISKWKCKDCGYNHGCPLSLVKRRR